MSTNKSVIVVAESTVETLLQNAFRIPRFECLGLFDPETSIGQSIAVRSYNYTTSQPKIAAQILNTVSLITSTRYALMSNLISGFAVKVGLVTSSPVTAYSQTPLEHSKRVTSIQNWTVLLGMDGTIQYSAKIPTNARDLPLTDFSDTMPIELGQHFTDYDRQLELKARYTNVNRLSQGKEIKAIGETATGIDTVLARTLAYLKGQTGRVDGGDDETNYTVSSSGVLTVYNLSTYEIIRHKQIDPEIWKETETQGREST